MRLINRLVATLLIVATTLIAGCEKPAPIPSVEHIPVTYAALDGCWQLTMWQGGPIAEDTYVYIEFDRTTRTYVMWDNLNSMYGVESTGSFTISAQENGRYILSGTYDFGKGDWSNEYYVELDNEGESMKWISHQVMDFVRIAEIPEFD